MSKSASIKQIKNELNLEIQKEKTLEVKTLYESIVTKYDYSSKNKYELKRLIGTLNLRRLTDFNNSENHKDLIKYNWFKIRYANFSDSTINMLKSNTFSKYMK
jgi:hypothetical protein